jgi:hypothetical protein
MKGVVFDEKPKNEWPFQTKIPGYTWAWFHSDDETLTVNVTKKLS